MKRIIVVLLVSIFLFSCGYGLQKTSLVSDLERQAEGATAASKIRAYHTLTGNASGTLDSTDVADLTDGDISLTVTGDGYFYLHQFEVLATNATSSPFYIRPHDYSTAGVHTLIQAYTTFPSSNPLIAFRDLEATDFDVNGKIDVQCTDVGSGTEDCDLTISVQEAGVLTAKIRVVAGGDITLLGDASFTDTSIKLNDDSSLSMDGTEDGMDEDDYNGITIRGRTCGENLLQWDLVVLKNDTDEFHKADANVAGEYPAVGISIAACTDGGAATVMTKGIVRNDGWTLTPGSSVYLGTNAGEILVSPPSVAGDYVQPVGWALDADHIYFNFARAGDIKAVGTGAPVRATSPTLVTPNIGVATGVSLNVSGVLKGLTETIGSFASPITANPYTLTAINSRSVIIYYGATGEIDLPSGIDGLSVLIYNKGAFTITIDPYLTQTIVRDGTLQAAGVSMTLSSGAGNFVTLVNDGTSWITKGYKGTLAADS